MPSSDRLSAVQVVDGAGSPGHGIGVEATVAEIAKL